MFQFKYDSLVKYLIAGRMTYLEQMETRTMSNVCIGYGR